MYPSTYYIDKTGGTIGDVLLAYGFADWLHQLIPPGAGVEVRLINKGGAFVVQVEDRDSLPDSWVAEGYPPALLPFIVTPKTLDDIPPGAESFQYYDEREAADTWWQAYHDLSQTERKDAVQLLQEQGYTSPHRYLPLMMFINTQKARNSYNKLVTTWTEHREHYPTLADLILRLFSTFPNDIDGIHGEWRTLAKEADLPGSHQETAVQIVNPEVAKGGNQPKANKLVESNVKAFWLTEYLRYVGMLRAVVPSVVRGSQDRKTYVPLPQNMLWRTSQDVLRDYQQTLRNSTAVKSDILAVLQYMQVFLSHWRNAQAAVDDPLAFEPPQPGDHAQGITSVFYKDMGSAHAVLDMSVLRLPRWMPDPRDGAEAQAYLDLIQEHQRAVRNLEEDHSDEVSLLQTYRRFLTTANIDVFLDFCAGLGALFVSLLNKTDARERRRAVLFSVEVLERMVDMQEEPRRTRYLDIMENPGFQNIASAIRQATFLPQWHKAKGNAGEYAPEYGLGHKLRQQAPYPDKFLAALGEFIQQYQAETLRKMEHPRIPANKGVNKRLTLSAEDLADVAYLVGVYGSEVVASLLVAAGYCWETRKRQTDDEPQESL